MTRLVKVQHENRLLRSLKQLTLPKVLIVDEIGYLPLSHNEASLFFRLVVRRFERAREILAENEVTPLPEEAEVVIVEVLAERLA